MGQFSVEKPVLPGSALSGNQHFSKDKQHDMTMTGPQPIQTAGVDDIIEIDISVADHIQPDWLHENVVEPADESESSGPTGDRARNSANTVAPAVPQIQSAVRTRKRPYVPAK